MPRLTRTRLRSKLRRKRRLAAVRRSRRARAVAQEGEFVARMVFDHVTKRYADGVNAVTDMNLAVARARSPRSVSIAAER